MRKLDYKALRAAHAEPYRKFSREVAAARKKEMEHRAGTAQARARTVLAKLYPEEWASLYQQARAEVDAERGPLPGDEQ